MERPPIRISAITSIASLCFDLLADKDNYLSEILWRITSYIFDVDEGRYKGVATMQTLASKLARYDNPSRHI